MSLSLTYVEIYNETIFDLLSRASTPSSITLVEMNGVVVAHGATQIQLQNEEHALEAFFQGEACRVIAPACTHALQQLSRKPLHVTQPMWEPPRRFRDSMH